MNHFFQQRELNEDPISGIYKIINKVTNKVYVGKSIDIQSRWDEYKHYLKNISFKVVVLINAFYLFNLISVFSVKKVVWFFLCNQ